LLQAPSGGHPDFTKLTFSSWDDWVPQDRLRKLTDDNKELAANLRREIVQPVAPKSVAKPTSKSRRGGSDRGSEERNSSIPAGSRGTKRGRDNDIEKVGPKIFKISLSHAIVLDETDFRLRDSRTLLFPQENLQERTPGLEYGEDLDNRLGVQPQITKVMWTGTEVRRSPGISMAVTGSRTGLRSTGAAARRSVKDVISDSEAPGDDGIAMHTPGGKPPRPTKQAKPNRRTAESRAGKLHELSSDDELDIFSTVDDLLARDPPPNELEYISNEMARSKSHMIFAPLIGGTTMDEKAAIERELVLSGKLVIPERYHPGYVETRQEDYLNHNRLLFFEAQDPRMKLAIAGVSKDPLQIDPPGCGSPFDALKFPDRLVEVLSRGVPLHGWDSKSFQKIPKHLIDKINPDDLLRCQKSTRMVPAPSVSPVVDGQVDTVFTLLGVEISTSSIRNSNGGLQEMTPHHLKDSQAYSFTSLTQEESFLSRPSIRIPIPDHLKNLLVDDWENVTKSLLLVPIPSQAPANFIIDSYFNEEKSHRRLGSAEADVLEEFCAGMKVYFEKSVGKILLYRFERAQLAEVSERVEELGCQT
jgi:MRG